MIRRKIEEYIQRTKSPEQQAKENAAGAKFAECGGLGVTYEEHSYFGTAPDIQRKNPGKTLAELMSDAELLDLLRRSAKAIGQLKNPPPDASPMWGSVTQNAIEHMKRDMRYLERIGRLPAEFKNFDVDAIEPAK